MAQLNIKQRQAGDVVILDLDGEVRIGDSATSLRGAGSGCFVVQAPFCASAETAASVTNAPAVNRRFDIASSQHHRAFAALKSSLAARASRRGE